MEIPSTKLRNPLACNFCRLHRKKCVRPSPTAKCKFCEKLRYSCSKDRSIKELQELLEGLLRSETEDHFATTSSQTPRTVAGAGDGASSPTQLERASTSAFSPGSGNETPYSATAFETSLYDRVSSPFSFNVNTPSVGLSLFPPSVIANKAPSSSHDALQLFEKLRAYHLTSESIIRHLEVVRNVDPHCALQASLATLATLIERRRADTISKIEKVAYDADDRNWVDQATWIYGRLLQEAEQTPTFPQGSRRGLLLRMARFYQRLGAPLEEAYILDQVANLGKSLSTSDQICDRRVEALRNASRAAGNTFAELPIQQVPLEFRNKGSPVPFVNHLLQHGSPRLVPRVLNDEGRAAEPPVNLLCANPFHVAALHGDTAILQLLANIYRSGIDDRDLLDRTPLFLAALCGHQSACELLLDFKVDKNARSITNQTALEVAARHGHVHIVKALCDRGADVNPLPLEGSSTPLQAAAEFGHLSVAQYLLETGKADLIVRRFGDRKTAKDLAGENGHAAIVGLLESAELSTQPNNDFFPQMQEFDEQMQL